MLVIYSSTCKDTLHEPKYSVLKPINTDIDIINLTDDTLSFDISDSKLFRFNNNEIHNKIYPFDTLQLQVHVGLPTKFFITINYHKGKYYVFPGYDRQLTVNDAQVKESGLHKKRYLFYDASEKWTNFNPYAIGLDIDEFVKYSENIRRIKLDSLSNYQSTQPDKYDYEFLKDEIKFQFFTDLYTYTEYHSVFYDTLIFAPDSFSIQVENEIDRKFIYDRPAFRELMSRIGRRKLFEDADLVRGVVNNEEIHFDNILYILSEIKDDRDEVIYDYIFRRQLIRDDLDSSDNLLLLNTISSNYYDNLENKLVEIKYYKDNYKLYTSLSNLKGLQDPENKATELVLDDSEYELIKLWFKGCYPCLKSIPLDKDLKKRYADLHITYIAYSTDFDQFIDYNKMHNLEDAGINSLFYSGEAIDLENTIGPLSAPRYIMIRNQKV